MRACAWRDVCPPRVRALLTSLQEQRHGGSVDALRATATTAYTFVVHDTRTLRVHTVTLGTRHACTCTRTASSKAAAAERQPCVHVLHVLTRHCGLAPHDALVWQAGMTALELVTYAQRDAATSSVRLPSPPPNVRDEVTALQARELVPEDYATLLALDADVPPRRVLSRDAFAQLPSTRYVLRADDEVVCGVCTDALRDGDVCMQLPCAHLLHRACAQRWLVCHHARCPLDYTDVC